MPLMRPSEGVGVEETDAGGAIVFRLVFGSASIFGSFFTAGSRLALVSFVTVDFCSFFGWVLFFAAEFFRSKSETGGALGPAKAWLLLAVCLVANCLGAEFSAAGICSKV